MIVLILIPLSNLVRAESTCLLCLPTSSSFLFDIPSLYGILSFTRTFKGMKSHVTTYFVYQSFVIKNCVLKL